MTSRSLALTFTLFVAVWPSLAVAQRASSDAQLRVAIIEALRQDAPPVPFILIEEASSDSLTRQAGALLNIPVRRWKLLKPAPPADTVAVRITVDTISPQSALATVVRSGSLRTPKAGGLTSWFVINRVELTRVKGRWVVTKLSTAMES